MSVCLINLEEIDKERQTHKNIQFLGLRAFIELTCKYRKYTPAEIAAKRKSERAT